MLGSYATYGLVMIQMMAGSFDRSLSYDVTRTSVGYSLVIDGSISTRTIFVRIERYYRSLMHVVRLYFRWKNLQVRNLSMLMQTAGF